MAEEEVNQDIEDSYPSRSKSERDLCLVRRVYWILVCQIIISIVLIDILLYHEPFRSILKNNLDVLYIAEITGMSCLFMLSMYEEVRCDQPCGSPVNLVTLFIYTISLAVNEAGSLIIYSSEQITQATVTTLLLFLGLSKLASYTEINFAFIGGSAVLFSFISRLISYIFSSNNIVLLTVQVVNLILTSVDILGDTQALDYIKCEDYIMSCANLYFHLLHMFSSTLILRAIPLE